LLVGKTVLEAITIQNYKSIEKLALSLGRINVFIGENGAGKSNILEAIALAGAADADKLDNEFLTSRGIRVTGPLVMRSAFKANTANVPIKVTVQILNGSEITYELRNDNKPYSSWQKSVENRPRGNLEPMVNWFKEVLRALPSDTERESFIASLTSLASSPPKKTGEVSVQLPVPKGISLPKFDTSGLAVC
jgi:energy-coupling factor transporter ATP-binding protein EcfA2